ncbi:MAG: quinolinate synthase NadA [Desulfobacterales bacterium]|nr:quinolinate synthase NadA [Desulfobacterales bacterium]MCP4160908.1 quinolinate synthase NadA [Deltaproteobacteria bacterium]
MIERIEKLKKEKNAIILAHNYEPPEIQEIADLCGDSLELSIKAAKTDAEVIVFCGVSFMAETAATLSPDKTVILPRMDAGCPMADMIKPEALKTKLATLPEMPVVTYVNTTAAVKALSTICCTSANVIKVVNSLNVKEILMTPDRNLAKYAAANTDVKIHLWEGYCPIHNDMTAEMVIAAKEKYKGAEFIAHPECPPEVLDMADVVTSTSGMIKYVENSDNTEFIIGTEVGILYPMQNKVPGKKLYPLSEQASCPDMKKITLTDVLNSLENLDNVVTVPENVRVPALKAVERMMAVK